MTELARFVRIDFVRFKAFKTFVLHLRSFNILVGPNNAGKSTILAAFRILTAAMRKAVARSPTVVAGPRGHRFGYVVDLTAISVAEENVFFNYDDSEAASVTFTLSNGNSLVLYFPEQGACFLLPDAQGKSVTTPTKFVTHFNCPIGFVPILGPVEHNEDLYEKEAARRALFSYQAARNFRNIWYHYPERFEEFRESLRTTWPGMDIERPVVDLTHGKPKLHMFCPEDRMPRELFWSGFGFQVWCQMLTHVIQHRDVSMFLIDEPDIYLHSDLQRQLLSMLRSMGPDILVATHSTEIISEAETDDIVLVNKSRKSARRISQPSQLIDVFSLLGSSLNPLLTQVAKTRTVLFVEGKDFQLIARFAKKLGLKRLASRTDFAVIHIDGFNIERARSIKSGIETTIGGSVRSALILDRDYRSEEEIEAIVTECQDCFDVVEVHDRKEIENFLLVPTAIDRAAARRAKENASRTKKPVSYTDCADRLLRDFASDVRDEVMAQHLKSRRHYTKQRSPSLDPATVDAASIKEFNAAWDDYHRILPGKEAIAQINKELQSTFRVSVSATSIVDAMSLSEVPSSIHGSLRKLEEFVAQKRAAKA